MKLPSSIWAESPGRGALCHSLHGTLGLQEFNAGHDRGLRVSTLQCRNSLLAHFQSRNWGRSCQIARMDAQL